jgi:GntR family transcriptional repressor for pyruvate dehydrogenase complex
MDDFSFHPVKARRLSEIVETSIRDSILNGDIKPGDKLPTEKEISRQFAVSSVTVREALRGLEAYGFIEKKKGKDGGIFVIQTSSDAAKLQLFNFLRCLKFTSSHLTQLRMIIEPDAAEIAAHNIRPQEIKELENNIRYGERMIKKGQKGYYEKEFFDMQEKKIEFHRLIAEATRNPVLALTIDYVMDLLQMDFLLKFKKGVLIPDIYFSTDVISDHRVILERLKEGDAPGAKKEMLSHIEKVDAYLNSQEPETEPVKQAA